MKLNAVFSKVSYVVNKNCIEFDKLLEKIPWFWKICKMCCSPLQIDFPFRRLSKGAGHQRQHSPQWRNWFGSVVRPTRAKSKFRRRTAVVQENSSRRCEIWSRPVHSHWNNFSPPFDALCIHHQRSNIDWTDLCAAHNNKKTPHTEKHSNRSYGSAQTKSHFLRWNIPILLCS